MLTNDLIKKQYKIAVRKYHPDVAGGSTAKMMLVNEAYTLLSANKFMGAVQNRKYTFDSENYLKYHKVR